LINYAIAVNLYDQTFIKTNRKVIDLLERAHSIFENRNYPPKDYATLLNQLGESYLNQYCRTKDGKDYRRAVAAFKRARSPDLSSPGSIPFVDSLIGTAVVLWTSCELQPQFDDFRILQEAISHLETARTYKAQGRTSTLEAECCLYLGLVYGHLYDPSLDNLHYLEKSIESSKRAVNLSKPNTPQYATALFNLAKQQCRRYVAMKSEGDLVEAERNVEKAKSLVERGYGTRDLPQGIEDLKHYIDSCKRSVPQVEDDDSVGLGKRAPCSMSRYYLRNT
jgi:tetratricopeptide (TPR) repeat protein